MARRGVRSRGVPNIQ